MNDGRMRLDRFQPGKVEFGSDNFAVSFGHNNAQEAQHCAACLLLSASGSFKTGNSFELRRAGSWEPSHHLLRDAR